MLRNILPPFFVFGNIQKLITESLVNVAVNELVVALCGGVLSVGRVSIIMLQKIAAIIKNVAADLCFTCSKVRWLL